MGWYVYRCSYTQQISTANTCPLPEWYPCHLCERETIGAPTKMGEAKFDTLMEEQWAHD